MVAQAARKLSSAGFKVTSLVREGDARDVILKHSESWRAHLMVGSHGRNIHRTHPPAMCPKSKDWELRTVRAGP